MPLQHLRNPPYTGNECKRLRPDVSVMHARFIHLYTFEAMQHQVKLCSRVLKRALNLPHPKIPIPRRRTYYLAFGISVCRISQALSGTSGWSCVLNTIELHHGWWRWGHSTAAHSRSIVCEYNVIYSNTRSSSVLLNLISVILRQWNKCLVSWLVNIFRLVQDLGSTRTYGTRWLVRRDLPIKHP